jgi:hypothetical protein
MLLDAEFTIDTILKSHLSKIAVILGIEVYICTIIFDTTKKTADKTTSLLEERHLVGIV